MEYPFKLGETVKTKHRLDLRKSGGPVIPKGKKAIVVKRFRNSILIMVDFSLNKKSKGIGRRYELSINFESI